MKQLNLEMSNVVYKRLVTLQKKTDATSKAEVIRKALALYEFAIELKEEGKSIVIGESLKVI